MKKIIASALVAGSVLGLGGVAGAAADKYELIGPNAVVLCESKEPISNDDTLIEGFANFNYSADGTVKVTVSLKGGEPNTEYPVRLVQNIADCHDVDGVLTTNGQGKGTLTLREPAPATGTAQVIVDTGVLFNNPTYRATETYSW